MDVREFLRSPFSGIRRWAASHGRLLAVGVPWLLAAVFSAVAVIQFLKSIGRL